MLDISVILCGFYKKKIKKTVALHFYIFQINQYCRIKLKIELIFQNL